MNPYESQVAQHIGRDELPWVIKRLTSHMITNGWMLSGQECPNCK